MTERDFRQLEEDLEQTVSKLKATKEPQVRRDLLLRTRRLLAEADRILLNTPE